jgi:glucokinase
MFILFDIGGTKTRITTSNGGDAFDTPRVFDTPKIYEEGIEAIKKTIVELSRGNRIQGIIGGIAGPFSHKNRSLLTSPNLSGWIGKPLIADLEKEFSAKVMVENDSAIVGLGEAVFGAGKGFSIVAYITISTGVGGARIVNGKIDEKSVGFEPGHQIVDFDKTAIPDADGIYLDNLISGKGVENRTGKKAYEITDESFWDQMAKILAVGLHNTIVHWSPDAVILGGSMMNKVGIPLEKVETYVKEYLKIFPEIPVIKKADLGDLGGLYGALSYLNNQSKNQP